MTQTMERNELATARGNGRGEIQRFNPNSLAADTSTLKGMLDASRDKLAAVIPRHLNPEKLMRVAIVAVSRSELLQKCTVSSILKCVMTGGQLGLDCSGVLGSAYMVPFYNSKINAYEATFIPGYRGLIDLARRTGEIEDIYAHPVFKEDDFDLELGAEPRLVHKPNLKVTRRDADIVGVYMVAFLKGNKRPHVEFMPIDDVLKIRNGSKGYLKDEYQNGRKTGRKIPSGPWHEHFSEMVRKTVVRRGVKYLPMSVELSEAIQLDDAGNDETRVISASTGDRPALMGRLTQKPVSEGQTLEPTAEAIADAEASMVESNGDEGDAPPTDDGKPEPDTSGDATRPPEDSEILAQALSQPWEDARRVLIDAAVDKGGYTQTVAVKIVDAHVAATLGQKGKESNVTLAQRTTLYHALCESRVQPGGAILPAKS